MSYDNDSNELIATEQSTVVAVAPKSADAVAVRIAKEVEGAMIVAKRFPRDENFAIERIRKAFQRPRLAEVAEYEYTRGQKIVGPSVDCLRAVKAAWGNIQSGWVEIERKLGQSTVIAYAMDLETNARAEVTFQVKHVRDRSERKGGAYLLTDERDIYECVANYAARRERKCLEDIIPADIIDEAVDQARKTIREGSKEPLDARVRKMTAAFSDAFQVDTAMLERRLGHKLDACSENELLALRRVYKSLHDGIGKREDYFDLADPKQDDSENAGKTKAERTAESLKGSKKPKAEPKVPEDAERSAKIRVNIKNALDRAFDEPPLQREAAIKKVIDDIQDPDNPVVSDDDRNWALDYVVEKKKGLKS